MTAVTGALNSVKITSAKWVRLFSTIPKERGGPPRESAGDFLWTLFRRVISRYNEPVVRHNERVIPAARRKERTPESR